MAAGKEPDWRRERRSRIVAAAGRLFGAVPFGEVQVDDIARAAGIGKPTLYRYFGSKEELFLAVLDEAMRDLESRIADASASAATPADALRCTLELLVAALGQHVNSLRLLSGDSPALAERWRGVYRARRRPILDALRRNIAAGIAAGQFRPVDPALTARLLIGMVRAGLNDGTASSRTGVAAAVADFAVAGLAERRPAQGRRRSVPARTVSRPRRCDG